MLYIGSALGYRTAQHAFKAARYSIKSTWKTRIMMTPGLFLTVGFMFIFLFGVLVAGSESYQLANQLEANSVYTMGLFLGPIALGFATGESYLLYRHHFSRLAHSSNVFAARDSIEHIDSEHILLEPSLSRGSVGGSEEAVSNRKLGGQKSQTQVRPSRTSRPPKTPR
jgi:hypothetical protein